MSDVVVLLPPSLIQRIFAAGRLYDSQRDGTPRSLCIETDGCLWQAQWTNKLPSDAHWTLRGAPGYDETSAMNSLLRLLTEQSTRDSGKHRSIK